MRSQNSDSSSSFVFRGAGASPARLGVGGGGGFERGERARLLSPGARVRSRERTNRPMISSGGTITSTGRRFVDAAASAAASAPSTTSAAINLSNPRPASETPTRGAPYTATSCPSSRPPPRRENVSNVGETPRRAPPPPRSSTRRAFASTRKSVSSTKRARRGYAGSRRCASWREGRAHPGVLVALHGFPCGGSRLVLLIHLAGVGSSGGGEGRRDGGDGGAGVFARLRARALPRGRKGSMRARWTSRPSCSRATPDRRRGSSRTFSATSSRFISHTSRCLRVSVCSKWRHLICRSLNASVARR